MVIPIPEEWDQVINIINAGKKLIKAMEDLSRADKRIRENGFDSIL